MNEQRSEQVYILNVQPATSSDQEIRSAIFEWKFGLKDPLLVPPSEVSIEVAFRVIKHKSDPSRIGDVGFKGGAEVGLRITAQRVGAKVKAYS